MSTRCQGAAKVAGDTEILTALGRCLALVHVKDSETVAAYARDDLPDNLRPVMQGWADICMEQGSERSWGRHFVACNPRKSHEMLNLCMKYLARCR